MALEKSVSGNWLALELTSYRCGVPPSLRAHLVRVPALCSCVVFAWRFRGSLRVAFMIEKAVSGNWLALGLTSYR